MRKYHGEQALSLLAEINKDGSAMVLVGFIQSKYLVIKNLWKQNFLLKHWVSKCQILVLVLDETLR